MAYLHPDKVVGVTRAIQQRPGSPRASTEKAAMRAASTPKTLTPQKKNADTGLMEQLAFRLRDAHWADHMSRLARNTDEAVAKAKATSKAAPSKSKSEVKPVPVSAPPIVNINFGPTPP